MGLMRGIRERADEVTARVEQTGEQITESVQRAEQVVTVVAVVAMLALVLAAAALVIERD